MSSAKPRRRAARESHRRSRRARGRQREGTGHRSTIEQIGQSAKGAAARMLEGIRTSECSVLAGDDGRRSRILWVDDRPQNNTFERVRIDGLSFTLARSTNEALALLGKQRFAAIVADMGRKEGPGDGYVLLEAVRQNEPHTPRFISLRVALHATRS